MNNGSTVSYWVIQIVETNSGLHELSAFPVSSTIDDQNYKLANIYDLTNIVEYNEQDQILYVRLTTKQEILDNNENLTGDTRVYGIDMKNKGNVLKTINWFNFNKDKKENIVGGNSRVFVEATTAAFWFDTGKRNNNGSGSSFFEVDYISDFTNGGNFPDNTNAAKLRDTYFQFFSLSPDYMQIYTFTYHGYVKSSIQAQGIISSDSHTISTRSDQYNFFLAYGDQDAYLSIVSYDQSSKSYNVWSGLLSQEVTDQDRFSEILTDFQQAFEIVYQDHKLFLLTSDSMYVLFKFNQIGSVTYPDISGTDVDNQQLMLQKMKQYYESIKK